MVSEKQIRSVAHDFLRDVAKAVRARFGKYPERELVTVCLARLRHFGELPNHQRVAFLFTYYLGAISLLVFLRHLYVPTAQ